MDIRDGVKWEKPELTKGRIDHEKEKYTALLSELKNNPGHWGVIVENIDKSSKAQYIATKIRNSKYLPDCKFEATARKCKDGSNNFRVSARCLKD